MTFSSASYVCSPISGGPHTHSAGCLSPFASRSTIIPDSALTLPLPLFSYLLPFVCLCSSQLLLVPFITEFDRRFNPSKWKHSSPARHALFTKCFQLSCPSSRWCLRRFPVSLYKTPWSVMWSIYHLGYHEDVLTQTAFHSTPGTFFLQFSFTRLLLFFQSTCILLKRFRSSYTYPTLVSILW